MHAVDAFALLFRGLHEADDRLQVSFRDLLNRYFRFLKSLSRGTLRGPARLRMRLFRDPEGRIRMAAWTHRIKATKVVHGRKQYLTRYLAGPLQSGWVYHFQKDWKHHEVYKTFDAERRTLNGLRSQVVQSVRRLRLALDFGWADRAASEDFQQAVTLVARDPHLAKEDQRPLAGAMAFSGELGRLETELGLLVEEFRRTFRDRIEIDFEPALRVREGGTLRLYWGFPQSVHTSAGFRTFTDYIPGRPTDVLMRQLRIRPETRKEVGAFIKRLRPVLTRYRRLVAFLGAHRRRVNELLARVRKLNQLTQPSGSPAPRSAGKRAPSNIRTAQ